MSVQFPRFKNTSECNTLLDAAVRIIMHSLQLSYLDRRNEILQGKRLTSVIAQTSLQQSDNDTFL